MIVAALGLGSAPPLAVAGEPGWLLRDARVWDADGARAVEAVVVRGDRIVSVGAAPDDVDGLEVVDLRGATVLPGLVDAHVHLSLTPSGAFLDLTDTEERALWRHHLAAYVACGVTTVLDTGIVAEDALDFRVLAAEGPSPEILFLGPLVSPEGGYVNVVLPEFPPTRTAAELAAHLDAFAPARPIGIKVTVEQGMVVRTWPLYTDEVFAALPEASRARGLPLYAHAMSDREYWIALDRLGVAGFVHPPQSPSRRLLERLAADRIPVTTTLSVFDSLLTAPHPERLADPLVALVVPEVEVAAAADPGVHHAYAAAVADSVLPRSPGIVRRAAARMFLRDGPLEKRLAKMGRAVRALHEAGVPLLAGSDSGNWPVFPFEFHGPTSVRELEILQEVGLSAEAALIAATRTPAEAWGLDAEIGSVAPGFRADLLVVSEDPLVDVSALRRLSHVMRAGELATPEQWISRVGRTPRSTESLPRR